MRPPTDQDDVSGTLFTVLQLADVKIRIVWRLEHVRALLLLVVSRASLEVRGREIGFGSNAGHNLTSN